MHERTSVDPSEAESHWGSHPCPSSKLPVLDTSRRPLPGTHSPRPVTAPCWRSGKSPQLTVCTISVGGHPSHFLAGTGCKGDPTWPTCAHLRVLLDLGTNSELGNGLAKTELTQSRSS